MELIRSFNGLGKNDAGIAGGKGASLGELTQAGIPVPPGFVVLAGAFERFLDEARLNQELDTIFHTVNHQEIRTVELASERIQALILAATMPEDIATEILANFQKLRASFVAVRSSATAEDSSTAAWAGQLDTFLNTTEETLLENVKRCWASLFTPRAIFYRFEKGMHGSKISVAVVVQKMVQSEVSGIAFSVHPVTEDYNQLIIEGGFGLGEAIVSGQVTPDSFVIEKSPRRIIDKNITIQSRALWRAADGGNEWRELSQEEGNKPALSDEQALELAELVLKIEQHYGFPCDIEWAFEAGTFFITQSRPITTLSPTALLVGNSHDEFSKLRAEDYVFAGCYLAPPFNAWFWASWYDPTLAKEIGLHIQNPGYVVFRNGYVYPSKDTYDTIQLFISKLMQGDQHHFFARLREKMDSEAGDLFQFIENAEGHPSQTIMEITRRFRRITFYWAVGYFSGVVFEEMLREEAEARGLDSSVLSDYIPRLKTPLLKRQAKLVALKRLLEVQSVSVEAPLEEIEDKIRSDAQLRRAFDKHLVEYAWVPMIGFLGEPLQLSTLIQEVTLINDGPEPHAAGLGTYGDVAADMLYLNQYGAELYPIVGWKSRPIMEKVCREVGVTLDKLSWLTPEEIYRGNEVAPDAKDKITKRMQGEVSFYYGSDMRSHIVDEPEIIAPVRERFQAKASDLDPSKGLRGQCGSRGAARGTARIIMGNGEFAKMRDGDVLFTSMTTPDFVPLMRRASAVVTDMGGILSHAVIMSRELGKPCVIGTKVATQIFKDGDMVEVDADNGIIRKI